MNKSGQITFSFINDLKIFESLSSDAKISESQILQSFEVDLCSISLKIIENEQEKNFLIKFKPIDNKYQDIIIDYINKNPLLSEEILKGNVPSSFISAISKEIPILPIADNEIIFDKDLNADQKNILMQMIARIIKEDSSLLFDIRGISFDDLSDEIKTDINSIFTKLKFVDPSKADLSKPEIDDIDFSDIEKNSIDEIFKHFPQNPVFYEKKDFKIKLQDVYDIISSEFDNVFIKKDIVPIRKTDIFWQIKNNNSYFFATPTNYFEIYLKSKGSLYRIKKEQHEIPVVNEESNCIEIKNQVGLVLNQDIIYNYFLSLNEIVDRTDISPSSKFFNTMCVFAKEMVKNLHIRPVIHELNEKEFVIKYTSNLNSNYLNKYLEMLQALMPPNLGYNADEKKVLCKNSIKYLVDDLINFIVFKILELKGSKLKSSPLYTIFTKCKPNRSYKGEKNLAKSISNWLNIFELSKSDLKVILKIDKVNDNYCSLNIDLEVNDKNIKLKDFLDEKDSKSKEFSNLALKIKAASEYLPILKDIYLSNGNFSPIVNVIDVIKLPSDIYVKLYDLNIEILAPKELRNIVKPKMSVKASLKKDKADLFNTFLGEQDSTFSLQDLMEFTYEVSIGDEKISKEEFLELVEQSKELVKYKDKYILLNKEEVEKILKQLNEPIDKNLNTLQLIHSSFSNILDDLELDYDDMILEAINKQFKVGEITLPKNLSGELRPYQLSGFKWLYSNTIKGFGSCMADDMGLGKTVQVIALIMKLREEKKLKAPVLVVCPTTLIGNWQKEFEKFTQGIDVSVYHGIDRKLDLNADVIMTTYGLLRADNEMFKQHTWSMIIIDEAQNIKNPNTAQTKAVKSLKTTHRIAMSGTPIENKLTELWSIFDFINKGYLATMPEFQLNYSVPVEKFKDFKIAKKLKMVTSPFVLRRLKTDKTIINDLPDKIIFDEYCYLAPEQAALYERTLNTSMDVIKTTDGISRRGNVLKLITSLKQICNHPTNYLKDGNLAKHLSGKSQKTLSIVEKIIENNEKALIFTQYTEMGDILKKMIEKELGVKSLFFHGSLNRKQREAYIDQFQQDNETKIMILSLKAGGTGLNLTAATNVIHYDLWWNPAVEDQATDRTYRIGQTENVTVHRLLTIGTFEEKIDEILKGKKHLVDMSLYTGEKILTDLSNDEIYEIFSLK